MKVGFEEECVFQAPVSVVVVVKL